MRKSTVIRVKDNEGFVQICDEAEDLGEIWSQVWFLISSFRSLPEHVRIHRRVQYYWQIPSA